MKSVQFISRMIKSFPLLLLGAALLLVGNSFFASISLISISPIIDLFIHPDLVGISPLTEKALRGLSFFGVEGTLASWLMFIFISVTLTAICNVLSRHWILKIKYAVLKDVISSSFRDFFSASWMFFSSQKQGVLLNSFTGELNIIGNAFTAMALFFSTIIQIICFLIVPLYISVPVTLLSLVAGLVLSLPFFMLGKLAYRLGKQNVASTNQFVSIIQESLTLAKVILGYGNQDQTLQSLDKTYEVHRQVTIKSQLLNIAIPILFKPFTLLIVVMAMFSSRYYGVPLSELVVLLAALYRVGVSLSEMTTQKTAIENFFPSYEQIERLRIKAAKLQQQSGSKRIVRVAKSIDFREVFFSYDQRQPVLDNISMKIPAGQMVAIVGQSGAGKSTIIDMIMGFYTPQSGRVLVDGASLNEIDIVSYRKRIGYVPQESILFNVSIKDNLLWAEPLATDADLRQACVLAYADDFIREFPQGYDTVVGDRGVRLSGGQVQRLALARAFLKKPDLLILDEATSALDTLSEQLIQKAIERVSHQMTIVMVAHRLSTIKKADHIYVLDRGKVIEQGNYDLLMSQSPSFKAMVHLQSLA